MMKNKTPRIHYTSCFNFKVVLKTASLALSFYHCLALWCLTENGFIPLHPFSWYFYAIQYVFFVITEHSFLYYNEHNFVPETFMLFDACLFHMTDVMVYKLHRYALLINHLCIMPRKCYLRIPHLWFFRTRCQPTHADATKCRISCLFKSVVLN